MKKFILVIFVILQYVFSQTTDSASVQEGPVAAEPVSSELNPAAHQEVFLSEDAAGMEEFADTGYADTVVAEGASDDSVSDEAAAEEDVTEPQSAEPSAPVKKTAVKETLDRTSPEEEPKEDEKEDAAAEEGFAFRPGLSFGTMTHDGQTWTRFSFRPEISMGKLGFAMDLELFMNDDQEFDSYGWNFDNFDNSMESLARKIYYVRWAHPGEKLYFKGGSLDDITLGYGLIMNNYGNTAQYPDIKLLGLHGQINHLNFLDANLELVLNSFGELTRGEGVIGGRVSVAPLSGMPLPLLSKLRFGTSLVTDLNQLAALPDRDGDNCPDAIDESPNNSGLCISGEQSLREVIESRPNISGQRALEIKDSIDAKASDPLKKRFAKGDNFSLMSLDAGLPIISMELISLEVYSELAFQLYQNSNDFFDGGYGLILPGVGARLGPVRARLESRVFKLPFFPGHFNSLYETERSGIDGMTILTKEEKYWTGPSEFSKGLYGSADVDLKKVVTVGGSYKMMFPESGKNQEGYSARAALGEMITRFIPKVAFGEIFWVKEKVGQDQNPDGDPGSKDGFFEPSIYTYAGYALGIEAGANIVVTVKNISIFHRDEDNELVRKTNLSLETSITF